MPSASTPEEKQAKVAAFHAARALRVERARNEVAAWNDAAIYKPEWEDAKRILSDAFEADWRTAYRLLPNDSYRGLQFVSMGLKRSAPLGFVRVVESG